MSDMRRILRQTTLPMVIKGEGGAFGSSSPSIAEDTLQTQSNAQILGLISAGPCKGFPDNNNANQYIYIAETPLGNVQGQSYYRGVDWAIRLGGPTQTPITGFSQASVETQVNVELHHGVPIIREITDLNVSTVIVTIYFPQLFSEDTSGNVDTAEVSFDISVAAYGAQFNVVKSVTINDKASSACALDYEIKLPTDGPWQIQVERKSEDSTSTLLQNTIVWSYFTEVYNLNLNYADSALIALQTDSRLFPQGIPSIAVDWCGANDVEVPSNYDPETRNYTGVWDGTFKTAYTDNPAWLFRYICLNKQWGLGEYLQAYNFAHSDYVLYNIAQYCDGVDEHGNFVGVPDGNGAFEPRFSLNCVLQSREQAFNVLRSVLSAFRAMMFWANSNVVVSCDMPKEVSGIVDNSKVVNGQFNRQSPSFRTLSSVAQVTFNDPLNLCKPAVEIYEDVEFTQRLGVRRINAVTAFGCRSRAQARRLAKWLVYSDKYESGLITFQMPFYPDTVINPGSIIAIMDANRAGVRNSGLIAGATTTEIQLDSPVTLEGGITYTVNVTLPDGTLGTSTTTGSGQTQVLTLASPLPSAPLVEAGWMLSSPELQPETYRVLTIKEVKPHIFEFTCMIYYPEKFAYIEDGIDFVPPTTTLFTNQIPSPPTNVSATVALYMQDGSAKSKLTFSWTPPATSVVSGYHVVISGPGYANKDMGVIANTYFDIMAADVGVYSIHLTSVGLKQGLQSAPVNFTYDFASWEDADPGSVSNLQLSGDHNNLEFYGPDIEVTWKNNFPSTATNFGTEPNGAGSTSPDPLYWRNLVQLFNVTTGEMINSYFATTTDWVYTQKMNAADNGGTPIRSMRISVSIQNTVGRQGEATSILVYNKAPSLLDLRFTPLIGSIEYQFTPPADADYQGVMLWVQTSNPVDITRTPTIDTASAMGNITLAEGTTYYIVGAAYDKFGKYDLIYTQQQEVTTLSTYIDVTPPPVPSGLTLTTGYTTQPDGSNVYSVYATWGDEAPTTPDLDFYSVRIKEAGSSVWYSQTSKTPSFQWSGVIPNTQYTVQVAAQDKSGNISAYCDPVVITSAQNSTPPNPPTSLTAQGGFQTATLAWTNPTNPDISGIEVWYSSTNDLSTASLAMTVNATPGSTGGARVSNLPDTGSTYYFWVRAFNTSKTYSTYNLGTSQGIPATMLTIVSKDLAAASVTGAALAAGIIDQTKVASGLVMPTLGTTNPDTSTNGAINVNLSDGQIYRYLNGKWTASVPTVSLVGQISTTQIAPGSITASLVASGLQFVQQIGSSTAAGSAGQVAINLTDGKLYRYSAVSGWTSSVPTGDLVGQIVSTQIAPNSISTGMIQANAITANQLAANSVTANAIAANSITSAMVQAGAITASLLSASSVTADKIAAGAVTANAIAANSISASMLQANSVTANAIAANSIIAGMIQAGAITATQLAAGSVTTSALASGAITTQKLAVGSVDYTIIADGAVTTSKIVAGSITSDRLAAKTITGDRIAGGTITGDLINSTTSLPATLQIGNTGFSLGVTAANAANPAAVINGGTTLIGAGYIQLTGSTTLNSWQSNADVTKINGGSIVANSIVGVSLAANSITGDKIAANTINAANSIVVGTVVGTLIADGAITTSKIVAGSITGTLIASQTVTADKINAAYLSAINSNLGTVTAGIILSSDARTQFNLTSGALTVSDGNRIRVRLGNLGGDYGITVYDAAGNATLAAGALGTAIIATANVQDNAITAGVAVNTLASSYTWSAANFTGSPVTIITGSIANSGYPVTVMVNLMGLGFFSYDQSGYSRIEVQRDGSSILTIPVQGQTAVYYINSSDGAPSPSYYVSASVFSGVLTVKDYPGGSSHTYSVVIYGMNGSQGTQPPGSNADGKDYFKFRSTYMQLNVYKK